MRFQRGVAAVIELDPEVRTAGSPAQRVRDFLGDRRTVVGSSQIPQCLPDGYGMTHVGVGKVLSTGQPVVG